jgi:hypothetical protein
LGPPFCPGCVLMGPHDGLIQVVHLPVQPSLCVFVTLQSSEYAIPHSGLLPAVEAARHRPPRTVLLGQIAPGCSGALYPEDGVYDAAMIGVRTAPSWLLRRQVWLQMFPLVVAQICSCHVNSVPTGAFCKHALAEKRRGTEEKRARRFRELYSMLNLKVVCHKDRSLEVSWGAHCHEWLGRG